MAWSDAARRAALLVRQARVQSYLRKKDPKSGVENVYRGDVLNRSRILTARIQAKISGKKQTARLGLTEYNETSDTYGHVTIGPRRRLMKGEVTRTRHNQMSGQHIDTTSLGKLRGSSSREITKKARLLARARKPGYHSPYS